LVAKRLETVKTFSAKTKKKTSFVFVLKAPRDQDLNAEDYITASLILFSHQNSKQRKFNNHRKTTEI